MGQNKKAQMCCFMKTNAKRKITIKRNEKSRGKSNACPLQNLIFLKK